MQVNGKAADSDTPVPGVLAKPEQKLLLIQCFRGLAAFAVVLFHAAVIVRERSSGDFFWKYFRSGATGVDFFFVLSGFIILWVHGKDIGQPRRVKVYAWRRFARVYPLYAICTLALIPLYLAGFGHAEKMTFGSIAKSFLLLPFPPGEHPIIGQGWTLCHEALFYVLFSSFILFGSRWAVTAATIFLTGSFLSFILPLIGGVQMSGPYWISHWIFTPYNLEFMAGCVAALIARKLPANLMRWCLPVGLAILALVWTIPARDPNELLVPDDRHTSEMILLFILPYTLITIGAVAWERHRPVSCPKFLLNLGDATYSVYLTHFVLISACAGLLLRITAREQTAMRGVFLLAVVLIACLGYLVYRRFEKPLLSYLRSKEQRIVTGTAH